VKEIKEEEGRSLSLTSREYKTYNDSNLKSPIEEELNFLLEEDELIEFE
jgi:hypothetical protein